MASSPISSWQIEGKKSENSDTYDRFFFLGSKITWRRQWHSTPVLLPGKSHGKRSLVGCSPWGRQQSDTTERLHFHFSLSCIGEGNGKPLQCSCQENPRDGGALVGCRSWGHTELDTTEATLQQQQQQQYLISSGRDVDLRFHCSLRLE